MRGCLTLPHQRGFMLLEVVVALILFSLGLVGMLKLQARASQVASASEDRNRAALLANEMVSSMWAQRNLKVDDGTKSTWQGKVGDPQAGGLPNGSGAVTFDDPQLATITIEWDAASGRAQDSTHHKYITKVVMP